MTRMHDPNFAQSHLNLITKSNDPNVLSDSKMLAAYADTLSASAEIDQIASEEAIVAANADSPSQTTPALSPDDDPGLERAMNDAFLKRTEELPKESKHDDDRTRITAMDETEEKIEKIESAPSHERASRPENQHIALDEAVLLPQMHFPKALNDMRVSEIMRAMNAIETGMPTMPIDPEQLKKLTPACLTAAKSEVRSDAMTPCYLNNMHEEARREHLSPNASSVPDQDITYAIDQEDNVHCDRTNSSELNLGHIVAGRYEILSEIARGGFGIVYRARQIGLDRIIALKRLKSQDEEDVVQRFLLEANIIKNLIHPNTIQLIDAGTDRDNHLFIVMEYIEGRSLQTVLNSNEGLSLPRAINITVQILKSLNEAHQRGIVHRDLKPSNILLRNVIGEHDFVKVLDFGIAKQTSLFVPKLTVNGKILGTPQYIAPELFSGQAPTPASDIYAIGHMLANMILARSLVPANAIDALRWHMSKEEAVLPDWVKAQPIGAIIQKAIQKDPEKRYQSAMEMISDLKRTEHDQLAAEAYQNIRFKRDLSHFIVLMVSVISGLLTIIGLLFYLIVA